MHPYESNPTDPRPLHPNVHISASPDLPQTLNYFLPLYSMYTSTPYTRPAHPSHTLTKLYACPTNLLALRAFADSKEPSSPSTATTTAAVPQAAALILLPLEGGLTQSGVFMRAPARNNSSTTLTNPSADAKIRGVKPSCSGSNSSRQRRGLRCHVRGGGHFSTLGNNLSAP
jgi:hypothetical protein